MYVSFELGFKKIDDLCEWVDRADCGPSRQAPRSVIYDFLILINTFQCQHAVDTDPNPIHLPIEILISLLFSFCQSDSEIQYDLNRSKVSTASRYGLNCRIGMDMFYLVISSDRALCLLNGEGMHRRA